MLPEYINVFYCLLSSLIVLLFRFMEGLLFYQLKQLNGSFFKTYTAKLKYEINTDSTNDYKYPFVCTMYMYPVSTRSKTKLRTSSQSHSHLMSLPFFVRVHVASALDLSCCLVSLIFSLYV